MNRQQGLQNIWAETDKSVIDMMAKKTSQTPSTIDASDSTDDNSDLESLNGSFVAVPKEFRPPASIRSKIGHHRMSLNENKQALSNQTPISISNNIATKTVPKILLPGTTKSETREHRTVNQNATTKTATKPALLATPKLPTMEFRGKTNQNVMQCFKKNGDISNHPKHLTKSPQNVNDINTPQENANMKNNSDENRKIFQPAFPKRNEALHMKESKEENGKKGIEYEYMPPTSSLLQKNGLKNNAKGENLKEEKIHRQGMIKKPNNLGDRIPRNVNKDADTILYQKNKVKWVYSLKLGEQNSDNVNKIQRNFGKFENKVLHEENMIKWDNFLNQEDLSNNTGKKKDFNKDGHRILHQKNTAKWDNSLNSKDSSSDSEDKIEWTVIQEKKTIVTAKKIEGKNHTPRQINNKCLPETPCRQNESNKNKRGRHKKNFNNKYMRQPKVDHRRNIPNHHPKNTENLVYDNDLQLNNSLKHGQTEIHNSSAQKECNLDAETFTRQCRVREQNLDYPKESTLPNDNSRFMLNYNKKEDTNDWETHSKSEKTDNNTHRYLEDQKKLMLDYGKEISDLIIGSHSALSMFISIFDEWKNSRRELITHFEYLERNLKESSKKFTKYKDLLNMAKTGASLAATLPVPHVSIAARVISVLTGLFSVFLSSKEKNSAEVEDSVDISIAATKDTSACYDLYIYGLQCGQQFEETAKLIEKFHSNIADPVIFEKDSPEIASFIRGVLEYKPKHRIFYKKLHRCFRELLQNSTSEFGKRFCEPFFLYSSDTIEVIEFLNWRFRHEDFNGESVRFELQEIERMIEGKDTSIKELADRIKICIGILEDELKFIQGTVKDFSLFDKPVPSGKIRYDTNYFS